MEDKKFIAPGAWFCMYYPASWSEFEDGEGSFLFYNPNQWTGNFRISAFRGNAVYGRDCVDVELRENRLAKAIRIGRHICAYSMEAFVEEEVKYENHQWVTGIDDVAFEISFAVEEGCSVQEAEQVIASLELRKPDVKYPPEIIPVRLSEIMQIDEAYEWVQSLVKEQLKKDFRAEEENVYYMQKVLESGKFSTRKREVWIAMGITLCVILANEVEGFEWHTLVDGNREAPVLMSTEDKTLIDPLKLVWSRVKAGEQVNLVDIYKTIL